MASPVADESASFDLGAVLCERYRVLELIGVGAMGAVYLGEHLEVGRKVAIKILLAEWSADAEVTGRFAAEARNASAIGHPGIIDVFDAGTLEDGRRFIVMEYHEGRDLGLVLEEHGPLPPRRACEIVCAVGEAIGAAHDAGIVHRDLKPDNIMIARRGDDEVIKVLDFGVAANQERLASAAATVPGMIIGTPEHMAPEQSIGEEVGPHFDIYALGSVLFTLLVGHPPFQDENPMRILVLKQTSAPPSLGAMVPGLPRALVEVVDDTLSLERARRPASAGEFVARLQRALAAFDEPVEPIAARRRAGALMWVGGAGLVALALTLAFTTRSVEDHAPAAAERSEDVSSTPSEDAPSERDPQELEEQLGADATTSDARDVDSSHANADTDTDGGGDGDGDAAALAGAPELHAKAPVSTEGAGAPAVTQERARARRSPQHETPACEQTREQAALAHQAYRWKTVLELVKKRHCWPRARDARKLETQARMEMGDFSGCVAAARGIRDNEVKRWRDLCARRGGLG